MTYNTIKRVMKEDAIRIEQLKSQLRGYLDLLNAADFKSVAIEKHNRLTVLLLKGR